MLTGYGDPNARVPDRYKVRAVVSNQCKLLRSRSEIKRKHGIPSVLPREPKAREKIKAYLEKLMKRNRAEVDKGIRDKLAVIAPSLSLSSSFHSSSTTSSRPPLSTEIVNSPPKKVVRKRKCADLYVQEGSSENLAVLNGGGKRRRVSRGLEFNTKVHPDDAHLFYF